MGVASDMGSTDRWIIVAAIVGVAASLGLSAMLTRPINAMRTEHQLTANEDVVENLPPEVAAPYLMLGSLRGVWLHYQWMRIEQMKQDGKFYELMDLSEWITKLQPRFPKVWANRAWNLAYNISVKTTTKEERWMWVRKGIDLLRDEGIPLNPDSVPLYKELGWIFQHKIGEFSDDMHWYYKQQLCKAWHLVLGPPPQGMAPRIDRDGRVVRDASGETIEEYAQTAKIRRIAWMYDQYLNRNELPWKLRGELDRLMQDARVAEEIGPLTRLPFRRFQLKFESLRERWADDAPDLVALLEPAAKQVRWLSDRSDYEPIVLVRAEDPDLATALERVRAIGFGTDDEIVRAIGELRRFGESIDAAAMGATSKKLLEDEAYAALNDWLNDDAQAEARDRAIDYLRASALQRHYHMDPLWMLTLMEGEWFVHPAQRAALREQGRTPASPIDWRHPGAHGLYWASLGVRRGQGILRPQDVDMLNTDRQVLHSLQQLMHKGDVIFDPVTEYIQLMPDPRYIDAYHYGVFGSMDRIAEVDARISKEGGAVPQSFRAGHANFLIWATTLAYMYGERSQAAHYYAILRDEYRTEHPQWADRFNRPLEEFVEHEFAKEQQYDSPDEVRAAINGWIRQAIVKGMFNNRPKVMERFVAQAQSLHARYTKAKQGFTSATSEGLRERMSLPPFDKMFADQLGQVLKEPGLPLSMKTRAWRSAPEQIRRMVWDQVRAKLYEQARAQGWDAEKAFPEPPGMEPFRERGGVKEGPTPAR